MIYTSLLLLCCVLLTQQTLNPVIVNRKSSCPVGLSGTVRPSEGGTQAQYPIIARMSATNQSQRDILLLITRVQVFTLIQGGNNDPLEEANGRERSELPERSELKIDEFYFRNSLFEPGSTITFETHFPPIDGGASLLSENAPRTATAEVVYAQFMDGTSWGDPGAAAAPLMQREQSLERLQQLLKAYRDFGELGLAGELSKESELPVVNVLQKLYSNDRSMLPAVVARIESLLQAARVHNTKAAMPAQKN